MTVDFAMISSVANQTSIQAKEFGFTKGDIVQEYMWDDDVDEDVRQAIEGVTGEDLQDEDYDGPVDGSIIWWRDGDDEDTLSDTIVDATSPLDDDAPCWILTPKPGRTGAAMPFTIRNAAKGAGMNCATPVTVSKDWNGVRLLPYGGREK